MKKTKRLLDEYRFPGFRPIAQIKGKFGDSSALIIPLERRQKKQHVAVVELAISIITTAKNAWCETSLVVQNGFIWKLQYAALTANNVAR